MSSPFIAPPSSSGQPGRFSKLPRLKQISSARRVGIEFDDSWMVSYADLITLLFLFFALMLSVSVMSQAKFEMLSSQFDSSASTNLNDIKKRLDAEIKNQNLQAQVKTGIADEGLQIQFSEGVLFPSGEVSMNESGQAVLKKFVQVLTGVDQKFRLAVEGHTDSRPIHNSNFSSNWSLSAGRSLTVLHSMISHGIDEKKLMVRAYADTRPISGADTTSAQNRRVTILVY